MTSARTLSLCDYQSRILKLSTSGSIAPDTFIDRALGENADIIGASILLTITVP